MQPMVELSLSAVQAQKRRCLSRWTGQRDRWKCCVGRVSWRLIVDIYRRHKRSLSQQRMVSPHMPSSTQHKTKTIQHRLERSHLLSSEATVAQQPLPLVRLTCGFNTGQVAALRLLMSTMVAALATDENIVSD